MGDQYLANDARTRAAIAVARQRLASVGPLRLNEFGWIPRGFVVFPLAIRAKALPPAWVADGRRLVVRSEIPNWTSRCGQPYVVGRILPALLAYTETGLASSDVLEDGDLRADFVTGFLAGDAQYERLEAILALNSFTNLVAPASAIRHGTQINLYHSEYDRLVPQASTRELAALLAEDFDVVHHDDECNNSAYESVFELVDRPGVLHLICGMEVLDDVLKRFP